MPTNLALAALVFVLAHRLISGSRLRARLVRRTGERIFQAAFSLLSLALSVWLVCAYLAAVPARSPLSPGWTFLVMTLCVVGCYLIVAGLTTRNPTIAGLGGALRDSNAIHGVIRLTRHPFLVGVLIVSCAHLLVLHRLSDWLFFGTLAFVALTGMHSIDRKRAAAFGADWEAFQRATSIVPAAAVLSGRQILRWSDIGALRPILGALFFALAFYRHSHSLV